MNTLKWLEAWYESQCNGDWEHACGLKIGTLDNPGWSIEASLEGTKLEGLTVERVFTERSDTDWINWEVKDNEFVGHGGPMNLEELVGIFKEWVEKQS